MVGSKAGSRLSMPIPFGVWALNETSDPFPAVTATQPRLDRTTSAAQVSQPSPFTVNSSDLKDGKFSIRDLPPRGICKNFKSTRPLMSIFLRIPLTFERANLHEDKGKINCCHFMKGIFTHTKKFWASMFLIDLVCLWFFANVHRYIRRSQHSEKDRLDCLKVWKKRSHEIYIWSFHSYI